MISLHFLGQETKHVQLIFMGHKSRTLDEIGSF
jgi:hypothetical protein